jgi:hypothetical protein
MWNCHEFPSVHGIQQGNIMGISPCSENEATNIGDELTGTDVFE